MPDSPKNIRGVARVVFRANQATIEDELNQGWTAKSIYERHADKLASKISYPQFARYVRALRPEKPSRKAPAAASKVDHDTRRPLSRLNTDASALNLWKRPDISNTD